MLKNRKIKIETIMLFFMTDNGISKISKGAKPKQDVLQKWFLKTCNNQKSHGKLRLRGIVSLSHDLYLKSAGHRA